MIVSGAEPEMLREAPAVKVCHGTPFLVMVMEFTFVALHEMVIVSPLTTRSGDALIETVGTRTVTVAMFELAVPAVPTQLI